MKETTGILYITIFLTAFVITILATNKIEKQYHDPKWLLEVNK